MIADTQLTDYQRIEQAIQYLSQNFQDQPNLTDLAHHLSLSPHHLQRLFKRWAGISPKRFLQFLTIDYAREQLRQSQSVLTTTYQAGLSSPGRLHDLFVTVDAVTPGEFKSQGDSLEIFYGFHPSPFGLCLLALTGRGICHLAFLDETKESQILAITELQSAWSRARLSEDVRKTQPVLAQIFIRADQPSSAMKQSVNLLLKGTNFQLKVWEAVLNIPLGRMCSYGDIAKHLGQPRAARAIGRAVSQNPIAYLIPCHRVIHQVGRFGHYQWGPNRKMALLGWEAAQVQ